MYIIEVREVSYSYHSGNSLALDKVNLRIYRGERLILLGANGSGKSTLIKHLNGILMPKSGEVLVKGEPITKKNLREVRRTVGVVYQNSEDQVFLPTVKQDVAFGPINLGLREDVIEQRVETSLRNVGLKGFEERSTHHLSEGEKKLVAIAGVLAMEPEVLVLDEPTAGLDPEGKERILRLIYRLNKKLGITLVIATHDVDTIAVFADRVAVLSHGRKIADATPSQIFSDLELLKESHLRLPIVTRLLQSLQNEGIPVNTKFTVEEAKKEILRVMLEQCTGYLLQT